MTYAIIGGIVVAVILFLMLRGGGRFPKPPAGEVVGTWAFVADPSAKRVAWDLDMPATNAADFVPYFIQWQLFYFGNGSAQHDESGPLRAVLAAVLDDPGDSDWAAAEVSRGAETLDFKGEFRAGQGFASFPGVIGVPRKDESLEGACVVVLQQGLAGPHAD